MKILSGLALVLAVSLSAIVANAGSPCCDHCGCRQNCKKVCRLVCETKKDKKVEYSCECEDFCVPGPSQRCGKKCDCDECGRKCCHDVWKPTCAKVRTRVKLIKKEVPVEKQVYTWVVEEVCCGCGNCLSQARVDAPPEGSEIIQASAQDEIVPLPDTDTEFASNESTEQGLQTHDHQPRGFWRSLFGR